MTNLSWSFFMTKYQTIREFSQALGLGEPGRTAMLTSRINSYCHHCGWKIEGNQYPVPVLRYFAPVFYRHLKLEVPPGISNPMPSNPEPGTSEYRRPFRAPIMKAWQSDLLGGLEASKA
jgi:hypothetical protein